MIARVVIVGMTVMVVIVGMIVMVVIVGMIVRTAIVEILMMNVVIITEKRKRFFVMMDCRIRSVLAH